MMKAHWGVVGTLAGLGLAFFVAPEPAGAVSYFARKYKAGCITCHVIPPKLNQTGEDFLARGYRFDDDRPAHATWPFAVWASGRLQREIDLERGRGLPNRVEIISGGPIAGSKAFYFVEWLPLSQVEFPLTSYVVRITPEFRQQDGRRLMFLEVGTVF